MSEFGTNFAIGFANKLTEGIEKRQDDARNYFNKQLEIAQTTGVKNRSRVKSAVQSSVSIAKQLQAVGVPKDIIMAQANQDPEGLGAFYEEVEKLRMSSKVPLTEEAYRGLYELSGELKNPDEDFQSFFSRMYDPIVRASEADPEGFQEDPKGSIWAAAFGFSAMGDANSRLGKTPVIDGMSAQDLIQYGDDITPSKAAGEVGITRNPQAFQNIAEEEANINFTTRTQIGTFVNEGFSRMLTEAVDGSGLSMESPEDVVTATETAYNRFIEEGNLDSMKPEERAFALAELNRLKKIQLEKAGAEEIVEEDAEPAPEDLETVEGESTVSAPQTTAETRGVTKVLPITKGPQAGTTLTFISNNFDGTLSYRNDKTGEVITAPASDFKLLEKTQ